MRKELLTQVKKHQMLSDFEPEMSDNNEFGL